MYAPITVQKAHAFATIREYHLITVEKDLLYPALEKALCNTEIEQILQTVLCGYSATSRRVGAPLKPNAPPPMGASACRKRLHARHGLASAV